MYVQITAGRHRIPQCPQPARTDDQNKIGVDCAKDVESILLQSYLSVLSEALLYSLTTFYIIKYLLWP